MSLVICKNGGTCSYYCTHKNPHERDGDCTYGDSGCCCVPVSVSAPMVKCNKADGCIHPCVHKLEHEEGYWCKQDCCTAVSVLGAKCEPVNNSPEAKAFILTPSEDHPEANFTIQAKDRTEALETALKQLGWKLL